MRRRPGLSGLRHRVQLLRELADVAGEALRLLTGLGADLLASLLDKVLHLVHCFADYVAGLVLRRAGDVSGRGRGGRGHLLGLLPCGLGWRHAGPPSSLRWLGSATGCPGREAVSTVRGKLAAGSVRAGGHAIRNSEAVVVTPTMTGRVRVRSRR